MRKRRYLSLATAVVLGMSAVMAGCSGKQEEAPVKVEDAVSDAGTTTATEEEPIEIELVTSSSVTLPEESQNFVNQVLNEKLGVKIDFKVLGTSGDYAAVLNTRIAGGDIPDLFAVDTKTKDSWYQYADTGVIMSLTPYLDRLQPVVDWAGENRLVPNTYKDQVFAIPKKWRTSYHTWVVRQDWMEKLGLETPTTLEESLEVAKALTFNDPDGNGKNDTYGFTYYGLGGFNAILNPYDAAVTNNIIIRDGKVTSSLLQPNMKAGLEMCKKWVDAGVVDPDIVANNFESVQDKVFQGQVAMGVFDWAAIYKKANMEKIHAVSPEADWQCISPMESGTGDPVVFDSLDVTAVRGDWVIGAPVAEDEKKLNKVIELLNYLVSEEGSRLVSYGIEGRHYNIEDGKIVPTELMAKECDFLWAYQISFRDDLEYLETKFPEAVEQVRFVYDIERYEIYNSAVQPPENFHKIDMDNYIQDNIIKFIYGQRPISEYDQFIEELNKTFDFARYLESAEQQLIEQGYISE